MLPNAKNYVTLGPAYSFISVKIVALNRFYIISMGALTLYHSLIPAQNGL